MFIEAKNVCKFYNGARVVDLKHFCVKKGESVSIMGAKNSGKTTLAKLIAGAICCDNGEILIDKISAESYTKSVYLPQKSRMIEHHTLLENMLIPLFLRGFSRFEAEAIAKEQLKAFGLLSFAEFFPCQANKSVLRLVSIAQTGLFNADLFIFDEPFSDVDSTQKSVVYRYINSKRLEGNTVLICTNSFEEAEYLTERTMFLSGLKAHTSYIA